MAVSVVMLKITTVTLHAIGNALKVIDTDSKHPTGKVKRKVPNGKAKESETGGTVCITSTLHAVGVCGVDCVFTVHLNMPIGNYAIVFSTCN